MLRRADRSSESKRRHSRFDREPSPKRSRRDGKPETEKQSTEPELDKDRSDRERHRRRLQDHLPLEGHGSKVEHGNISKESEKHQTATKYYSDSTKAALPRSYFQQDDCGSAGQNGRSFSRRTDRERGWWRDPKEQLNDRTIDKTVLSDARKKDVKSKDSREDNHVWLHDGCYEMEANPNPPVRKRPAFREQKIPANPEKTNTAAADPVMRNLQDHYIDSGKGYERGRTSRLSERSERPFSGDRELKKDQYWRGNFTSRDRYSANSGYRGRDRFSNRQRQGYHPSVGSDEANNKSPPQKNEEDQISKIEAPLAS